MSSFLPFVSFERAVELMKASQPVVFPTETFFGLGSRAMDANASARVFCAKHRATGKPLPLIIGDMSQLDMVAKVDSYVRPLLEAIWPAPLSVILPAYLRVPDILTGGTGRVAVRLSSHPVAARLAREVGEPVTASSANISGIDAVTSVDKLDPELIKNVSGVLNMPPQPSGGLPSTLVEPISERRLRVLRLGAVDVSRLEALGYSILTD